MDQLPKLLTEKQQDLKSRALSAKYARPYFMTYMYPKLREMYYKTLLTSTQEKEILDTLSQMRNLENIKEMIESDIKNLVHYEKEIMPRG